VRLDEPHRIVQVAVCGSEPLPSAQTAAVRAAAASARDRGTGLRPARIEALPERLGRAEARARTATVPAATWVMAGLGGDAMEPVGVDLEAHGPGLVVTGEPRSGRSTALLNMALDLVASGLTVVAFAPGRNSPLRQLAGVPGVAAVLGVPSPTLRQAQLAVAAAGSVRHVLVVDDADLLMRTDVDGVLRDRLRAGDRRTVGAVFAASAESMAGPPPGSFLGDAARGACVLVLGARTARVPLLGSVLRLSEAYVGSTVPGRGVFVAGGTQTPVQVPAVEPDEIGAGSVPRAVAILQVTEALAGPAAATIPQLTAIVDELRAAGFDRLDEAMAARAVTLAVGWSGTPEQLVAAAAG
jgi:S-DNA-T family DNA segregation ATPase FtsK/SpoIIIE